MFFYNLDLTEDWSSKANLFFYDLDLTEDWSSKANLFFYDLDLIEDWSSKARPDILKFIPYTVHVVTLLKEFELATLTNEYNWIDCFGHNQENGGHPRTFVFNVICGR